MKRIAAQSFQSYKLIPKSNDSNELDQFSFTFLILLTNFKLNKQFFKVQISKAIEKRIRPTKENLD